MANAVTFHVFTDLESGSLCASGVDHSIHTCAQSWDALLKNIHDAVECHFDSPYRQITITIVENYADAEAGGDAGDECD